MDYVFQVCIPNLHINNNKPDTHNLAVITMDYEGIMDIIMKTLWILGISYWHNIHNLKNRQIAQVLWPKSISIIHLIHIKYRISIYINYLLWHTHPVRSRLCQIRLHHVFASSPKVLGPAWQVRTSCFFGTWFWWISVNCSLVPVTASTRIFQTGSNVAWWFYLLHCTRDAHVCWNRTNIFWFLVCPKWHPKPIFPLIINWDFFEW